jgi:hypothetical protein
MSEGGARHRKRPKSFLQKARKFGKLGQRGRGTNIAQVGTRHLSSIRIRAYSHFLFGLRPSKSKYFFFYSCVLPCKQGAATKNVA